MMTAQRLPGAPGPRRLHLEAHASIWKGPGEVDGRVKTAENCNFGMVEACPQKFRIHACMRTYTGTHARNQFPLPTLPPFHNEIVRETINA